jgi:hypothetical protein
MRIIPLSLVAFCCGILASFSQTPDSTYKKKKLNTYEVNFITSYYGQDGNNSAVTGGIGTEKLTDYSTALDLTINRTDSSQRSRIWNIELAMDAYTSASSDKIDPTTISSASSHDTRVYPSVSYTVKNEAKRYSIGGEASFSKEFDYTSVGAALTFSKFTKDHNREFSAKLQAFFDTWKIILPVELRSSNALGIDLNNNKRNSYSAAFVYSQVVNERFQYALLADPSYQQGLLGTLYQRIYFNDGSESVERLPDARYKLPIGARLNWFLSDRLILRTFLRYYMDSWNLHAETFSIETPYKVNPLFSISPFYRFYTQTAIKYFGAYKEHLRSEEFYSCDYDLSASNSHFFGINLRKSALNGIFGIKNWNNLELRLGHYIRSTGLRSNAITLAATFK